MKMTSKAFDFGAAIPVKYTGAGQDVSPPLAWSDAPKDAKSFALILDDPDAPSRDNPRPEGPWVHWIIYNISADRTELPEDVSREPQPETLSPAGQGKNDFVKNNVGYRGPMPPKGSGPHRYVFTLYAFDRQIDLPAKNADKQSLLVAMDGRVLARGELIGTFQRD